MQKEPQKEWNSFRFDELRVYHKALDLAAWLRAHTSVNSLSEDCEANKLVNSATQIAIAIAEGSARNKAQFVYFLRVALSNIREVDVRTNLCIKLHLMPDEHGSLVRERLVELTRMLTSLINSIQKTAEPDDCDDDGNVFPEPAHKKNFDKDTNRNFTTPIK